MSEACITECDEIILWFGEGEYVEKAKELKAIYVPPDFNKRELFPKIHGNTSPLPLSSPQLYSILSIYML